MKRSKSIGLLAMSASVIALTACEEPAVDAAVFENLSQCLADPNVERAQCEADYQAAKSQHAQVSPKYTSQQDCEADFGAEQYGPAFTVETGMFLPFASRVRTAKLVVQTLLDVFAARHR